MLELPQNMRELLVDHVDEYLEGLDDLSDRDAIAEATIEAIMSVTEHLGGLDAEEIIAQLEDEGDFDTSLLEVLGSAFADVEELTGAAVVKVLESICEVDWVDQGGDDDGSGFFGDAILEEDEY